MHERFNKKWRFSLILRYFSERYTVCCGTVRYNELKVSDKFALPTVSIG
jgi:hypothetical protein